MTNVLATNAVVPKTIDTQYFLRASKQGFPISGQVPRTYQIYAGIGNETFDYDGSNEIRVFGQTLTGPLTINFGPLRNIVNWIGRTVTLNIISPINQTITLTTSPAFMSINGTALQQLSHVIAADNRSKSISIYFHSITNVNLDYGASAASVVPGSVPTFTNLGSGIGIYANTAGTNVNLRSILAADPNVLVTSGGSTVNIGTGIISSSAYQINTLYGNGYFINTGLIYNPSAESAFANIEPLDEFSGGRTTMVTGLMTGVSPFYTFTWDPPPRCNRPITIGATFSRNLTGELRGNQIVTFEQIMQNVFEKENVMGIDTSDLRIHMYDPDVDAGGVRYAGWSNSPIPLNGFPVCIATDLQDNLMFYTRSSEPTSVYVASTSENTSVGAFPETKIVDLTTTSVYNGNDISDLCYDEINSVLYILPAEGNGRLYKVPILPKSFIGTDFLDVNTGPISYVDFDGVMPTGSVYSICLTSVPGEFAISYDDSTTKIGIFRHNAATNALVLQYAYDTSVTGQVSLMLGSKGRLIAQYESTGRFYVSSPGRSLLDGLTVTYRPSVFMRSLTVNCYNYFSIP